jgi:uncharacterized membrane protein
VEAAGGDLTEAERRLIDRMLRRVGELKSMLRADDGKSQAQMIHATDTARSDRLDSSLVARPDPLCNVDQKLFGQVFVRFSR